MTTGEFIKMLQKEDPSGNAHIRMDGGFPWCAVSKEGYWDGPYAYLDENDEYHYSIEGTKVDIYCMGVDEFVEQQFRLHDPDNWEKIKQKFHFHLDGYSNEISRRERMEGILKTAKDAWDGMYEIYQESFERSLAEMTANAKKGWRWFQDKKVELNERPNMYVYYHWLIYDENGKEQGGSNVHMTQPVLYSGQWEKIESEEKNGYFEWKFKTKF